MAPRLTKLTQESRTMHQQLRSCNHLGRLVLDLGMTPLADEFPANFDEAVDQTEYPLGVLACYACGMLELTDFVDDDVLFSDRYAFHSGTSPALVRHFDRYATWIKSQFANELEHGVVEIACNDGTLLKHFKDFPHIGVDPARPVERAAELGLNVVRQPFTADAVTFIMKSLQREHVGLVIANNVIAHVSDFHDFLAGVAQLIGRDGVAVLEFQYLPDLLLGNQFDLIYHEHRRFLSIRTLDYHAQDHGLRVVDALPIDTQGGSVRVTLLHRDSGPRAPRLERLVERETLALSRDAITNFAERVDVLRELLHDAVEDLVTAGQRVALYGAPAKATTLLRHANLDHDLISYAVDLTPEKIGKYMPGTEIPVIAPHSEGVDVAQATTYLLAIPNYLGSVLRREREYLDNGGQFLVPLPKPVII